MRLSHKINFILISIVLSFGCCKTECKKKDDVYKYIPDDEKAVIKYTGNETLRYLHNNKDTLVFEGIGKSHYFSVGKESFTECPEADVYKEHIVYSYLDHYDSTKFFLEQYINYYSSSEISFVFKKHKFNYVYGIFELIDGSDSLKVLNKTYRNVSVPLSESYFSDTLYYDKNVGIIKVVTQNESWELIQP